MKDSSKARYAVAALVDLAGQPAHQPTILAAIAKRQEISVSYLEHLFVRLRASGLIKSAHGPGGGNVWRGPVTRSPSPTSMPLSTLLRGPRVR